MERFIEIAATSPCTRLSFWTGDPDRISNREDFFPKLKTLLERILRQDINVRKSHVGVLINRAMHAAIKAAKQVSTGQGTMYPPPLYRGYDQALRYSHAGLDFFKGQIGLAARWQYLYLLAWADYWILMRTQQLLK